MFNIQSVHNMTLKTRWKPDAAFNEKLIECVLSSAFSDGYWYISRKMEDFVKSLSYEQVSYIWTNYKSLRPKIVEFLCQNSPDKKSPDSYSSIRTTILNNLLSEIPVDIDIDNNKARAYLHEKISSNFDYLQELTNARISSDQALINIWTRAGLGSSSDENFYDAVFFSIKREKGSVDEKVKVLNCMFNNDIFSSRIILQMSKTGTKNIKRTVVRSLCGKIDDIKSAISWRSESEEHKKSLEKSLAEFEERAILYASTDDYEVVAMLAASLSSENLPWIMPSASKYPYIMRDIQYKIERSSKQS